MVEVGQRWLHRKGGKYQILATGKIEKDLTEAVVYQSEKDLSVWIRPLSEFLDGRFTQI